MTRDTETAKKEAEILQLKATQLDQEIGEQRKVEKVLQEARDALEHQVKLRTSELSDTVALLQQEIVERERAEAQIQQLIETLEQRVAVRTDELATFFDLTLLAGQGDARKQRTHSNRSCLAAWHHAAIAARVANVLPLGLCGGFRRRWLDCAE